MVPLREEFEAIAPKKLVEAVDCNPNVSPSAAMSWKKLASFMMDFALVFLIVMVRRIVVEFAPVAVCLLILLIIMVRSARVII